MITEVTTAFHTQYKEIMKDSLGDDSIFSGAVDTLNGELDKLGLTGEDAARLIQGTISQMAVAISASSMSTALELVLRVQKMEAEIEQIEAQTGLILEQTKTEKEKTKLVTAQTDTEKEKALLIIEQTATEKNKTLQVAEQTKLITAQTATEKNKTLQVAEQTKLIKTQEATEKKKPALIEEQTQTEDKKQCVMQSECDMNVEKKELLKNQQTTETNKASLTLRQTTSFDDKNRQEAMKSMAGIAQMMGTTGDIDETGEIYKDHKITVNNTISKTDIPI